MPVTDRVTAHLDGRYHYGLTNLLSECNLGMPVDWCTLRPEGFRATLGVSYRL